MLLDVEVRWHAKVALATCRKTDVTANPGDLERPGGVAIEVVADTSAHTNSGKGYFCIENAASGVIATVTASDINDGTAVTAYTLGAGERLFGRISTFTLTSGKVKAYRNP